MLVASKDGFSEIINQIHLLTRHQAEKKADKIFDKYLRISLYTNDYYPNEESTAEDFEEVFDKEYLPQILRHWTKKYSSGFIPNAVTYEHDFAYFNISDERISCYGYFVTNLINEVLWAERFPTPYPNITVTNGYTLSIKPKFNITSS